MEDHELMKNPSYRAMRARQEAEMAARNAILDADESSMLAELVVVGEPLKSVWDLVNRKGPPMPAAIPILVAHLGKVHHHKTLEGIARALTVPEARGVPGQALLTALERSTSAEEVHFRWALLNALTEAGDSSLLESLEALVRRGVLAEQGDRIINAALRGCKKRKAQS